MAVKVAINGFGRIGRNVLRAIVESGRTDIEVVAINDLGPVETNAHLLRFDSVHGRFPAKVTVAGDTIDVGHGPIKVTAIKNPAELPHRRHGRRHRDGVHRHLHGDATRPQPISTAGAKRVLVSAPADGADLTVVYGVNHDKLTKDHLVVSNASCTTNCLAPVAKVLHDLVGIDKGFMTTIHCLHRRPADARHDAQGSLSRPRGGPFDDPDLDRRRQGRRPRAAGTQRPPRRHGDPRADAERVGRRLQVHRQARNDRRRDQRCHHEGRRSGPLKGVLGVTDQPNVSIDFNHDSHSSIFHLDQTKVMDGKLVRVLSWYDNEWGFSNRMSDTAVAMAKLI